MQFCSDPRKWLVHTGDTDHFHIAVSRLHILFKIYADTSPAPLPAPGLIITPEIRSQCECYLPIASVAAYFYRLYRSALNYPPILSSTPFHKALSWVDVFVALPPKFQFSANPARILEALCADYSLLTEFLFASFLPFRFYDGFGRYPRQLEFIRRWLTDRNMKTVRCLDAACGTGEGVYDLACVLSELGLLPEEVHIDGWTLDPLEVWAAATRRFPHDLQREVDFQKKTSWLFERKFQDTIYFRCADLLIMSNEKPFDLIICNGLLGGPIMHRSNEIERVVMHLAQLLASEGILLATDRFHGGWKQHCPQEELQAVFERHGLEIVETDEGIAGRKW